MHNSAPNVKQAAFWQRCGLTPRSRDYVSSR